MPLTEAKVMPRLKKRYLEEIRPQLVERFGYSSPMQAPKIEKIVLNMGLGEAKTNSGIVDQATEQLATIAGQQPNVRRARKSIAAFKLREGMPIGIAVTLRDARMYEFVDRLVSVAIPRIRDFRGLNPKAFDGRGNYALGVREQIIFPEIDYDAIDQVRGLDVVITTSAQTDEEAYALLELLGMPFRRDEREEAQAAERRAEENRGGPAPAPAADEDPAEAGAPDAEDAPTPAAAAPGGAPDEQQPSEPETPVEPNAERDPDAADAPENTDEG